MARICTGPSTLDWECAYAGDDVRVVFRFLADGDPWDLTGTSALAQARTDVLAADPPTLTASTTLIDAVNGLLQVAWDGEEIRTAIAGGTTWEGVWDLQITEPSGDIQTVVAGQFLAKMDVSR